MWHPASLLLAWLGLAIALQWLSLALLAGLVAVSLALMSFFAAERGRKLLGRSRWLLLSLTVLFLFLTPGEFLPGFWGKLGLTYEGLLQAGEQLGRLLAMLASLALLHQQVGTRGLLAGLYWLLGPFPWGETTVVRLMLVLEFAEQKQAAGWRDWLAAERKHADSPDKSDHYALAMPAFRKRDGLLLGGLLAALLGLLIWS